MNHMAILNNLPSQTCAIKVAGATPLGNYNLAEEQEIVQIMIVGG